MIRGTTWSCSKLLLKRPIKKPNRANVKETSIKRNIIKNGYWTWTSTKNKEVINKSGILKIIGRKPEEFPEINGTKRLFSDQIVVEDMLWNLFLTQMTSENILA